MLDEGETPITAEGLKADI
jgi:dynein heavy chain